MISIKDEIIETKIYDLKINENIYSLSIEMNNNKYIIFTLKKKNANEYHYHMKKFQYNELIDKLLLVSKYYDDLSKIVKFIDISISKQLIDLIEDKNHIKIHIKKIIDFDEVDCYLDLDKLELTTDEKLKINKLEYEQIIKENKELKNKISNLEKNINSLNEKNNEIKKENKIINEKLNNQKEEITKIKSENNNLQKKIISLCNFIEIFNSNILTNCDEKNKFINLIKNGIKNTELIQLKLLFRASRDGDNNTAFHQKCDNKSPTISIIQTKDNYIFGGYTEHKWDSTSICVSNKENETKKTFMFSFNKLKIYNGKNGGYIHCGTGEGPWFCNGAGAQGNNYFKTNNSYQWELEQNKESWEGFTEKFELVGGKKNFYVKEVEVFEVKSL